MKKYTKIITVFTVILLNILIITACDIGTNQEDTKSVSTPSATPASGTYTTTQIITLTTATSDAAIHYTIDGSNPTTGSTLYTSPITISTTTTLKAIAIKSGMANSEIFTAVYTINSLLYVAYDAAGGTPAPASPVNKNPGDIITQPQTMTKDWHTFDAWYTDSNRTEPAVFPITVTANVNLYAKWIFNTITNIADVSTYLASLSANTSSNPVNLSINIELGTMTEGSSGWQQLLDTISTSGKFVNIDLSACAMSGTSFNPDLNIATGKDKIVSIVLPAAATSIEKGSFSDSTFKNFTNLKSISGENVLTIGEYAFYSSGSTTGNKNLQNIDFPKVTNIGNSAFAYCTGLQNADLPQATNIGYAAFRGCTSLQSISFPASVTLSTINPTFAGCTSLVSFTITGSGTLSVIENGKALVRNGTELVAYPSASGTVAMNTITTIGIYAFSDCTGLQGVSFPAVAVIGNYAFDGCANLQSVNFPLATTIGSNTFNGCKGLQTADFPEATNIGSMALYSCTSLQSLYIPKVTNIGMFAFGQSGNINLTITLGSSAPTLGAGPFTSVSTAKTVTVKVPDSSSGYTPFTGSNVTVSGADTTANWANGLRGGGWTGSAWATGSSGGVDNINQNITLIIQAVE